MAYVVDLQDRYEKKSFDELVRIIKKDYRLIAQGLDNDKLALVAIMSAFNKFVYNTDYEISQTEHRLFNAVLEVNKTFEEFKRSSTDPSADAVNQKIFSIVLSSSSMLAKCALLEACLCICACDGHNAFEWMELDTTFPSYVIDNFDDYIR